jgi:carboxyl-terminal processing protease
MRRNSSIFAPGLVLLGAALLGGWFLQKGVGQEKNLYLQVRLFEEVVDRVVNNYVDEVDPDSLYRSAIGGVLQQLDDPNTSFLPASDFEDLRIRTQGEYGGVGLEVIEREGWVTVVTPLPGTPGTRAGIRAGDQIVEVEGEPTDEWEPDEVVDALRGRPGTDVTVGIRRPGVDETIHFTVTRAQIELHTVPFALQLNGDVGYVPLAMVSQTSGEEVRRAVDSLRTEGVDRVILDLRRNPGGLLDQGVAITDFFLDPGQAIVETRGRGVNQTETYSAYEEETFSGLTVVVLVDERSASASEIIAGALQDHDRGVVVGAPTWGKGSVQTLFQLTGGNVLRLTTARWYTPSGRSIHKEREDQIAAMERSVLTLDGFLAARPDTTPRPLFQSMGGRTLYGGGGITPDVLVMADTLTTREREAIRELDRAGGSFVTAVFNFAVSYLQDHPDVEPDFRLTEAELEEFRRDLEEAGVELTPGAFRRAERFLRYQLEGEIALQAWGEKGEFRRNLPYDRIIQRALDLLDEAASAPELLELAARPEYSDWTPEVARTRAAEGGSSGEKDDASGTGDDGTAAGGDEDGEAEDAPS